MEQKRNTVLLSHDHNIKLTFEDYKLELERTHLTIESLKHNIKSNPSVDSSNKTIILDRIDKIIFSLDLIQNKTSELKYFVEATGNKKT